MCSILAGLSVGTQVAGNYIGQKSAASAAQAQMDSQAKAAVTQMNFAFQNYEAERTDAFDAAVDEIIKTRQNSMQLNSGVKAAVYEGGSGRTSKLLIRNAEGDTAKAVSSVQGNYNSKNNEVDLNKEAVMRSTRSTLEGINANAPKMPSRFTNFLTTAGTALGVATDTLNQKADVESKGKKWNYVLGGAK